MIASIRRFTVAALACALPSAVLAVPPESCSIVKLDEVNTIADGAAAKIQPRKSGNPTECGFLDSRQGAVLVISIREVQYAVQNELQYERENLEKIYRTKAKMIDTVGEGAFWIGATHSMYFRKGKNIVSVTFSRTKNQNEVDTGQIARLIDSRLK